VRWPDVLEAVVVQLKGSAALAAIIAPSGQWKLFKSTAPRDVSIPHASLFFLGETYRESLNDMLLQVSLFASSVDQAIALERAVRDAIDRQVWSVIGGIYMRCELEESADVPDPEEEIVHRALTFGVSLPRERYAQEAVS
jgi:hypothetical protein